MKSTIVVALLNLRPARAWDKVEFLGPKLGLGTGCLAYLTLGSHL